jgi:hypothetical protein
MRETLGLGNWKLGIPGGIEAQENLETSQVMEHS